MEIDEINYGLQPLDDVPALDETALVNPYDSSRIINALDTLFSEGIPPYFKSDEYDDVKLQRSLDRKKYLDYLTRKISEILLDNINDYEIGVKHDSFEDWMTTICPILFELDLIDRGSLLQSIRNRCSRFIGINEKTRKIEPLDKDQISGEYLAMFKGKQDSSAVVEEG